MLYYKLSTERKFRVSMNKMVDISGFEFYLIHSIKYSYIKIIFLRIDLIIILFNYKITFLQLI